MLVGSLTHTTSQWKPFNPLLGETFQGHLDAETQIFVEQVSHQPPMSRYLITSPLYRVHGMITYNGHISTTRLTIYNEGWNIIDFHDGGQLRFFFPPVALGGVLVGNRTVHLTGTAVALDPVNLLKGVIRMNDKKKGGFFANLISGTRYNVFSGEIYRFNPTEHEKLTGSDWLAMTKAMEALPDKVESLATISGEPFEKLVVGDEPVWDIHRDAKHARQQKYAENPLPSDLRFREDLIWLSYGNEKYAQEWKLRLEEQQRYEKKLRTKKTANN